MTNILTKEECKEVRKMVDKRATEYMVKHGLFPSWDNLCMWEEEATRVILKKKIEEGLDK